MGFIDHLIIIWTINTSWVKGGFKLTVDTDDNIVSRQHTDGTTILDTIIKHILFSILV